MAAAAAGVCVCVCVLAHIHIVLKQRTAISDRIRKFLITSENATWCMCVHSV